MITLEQQLYDERVRAAKDYIMRNINRRVYGLKNWPPYVDCDVMRWEDDGGRNA